MNDEVIKREQAFIEEDRFQHEALNQCFDVPHTPLALRFLFTTSSGIFLYDQSKLTHLIRGFCFGIVQVGDWYYFTQQDDLNEDTITYDISRIGRFRLIDGQAVDLQLVCTGMPEDMHQLAYFKGDIIYVQVNGTLHFIPADTRNAFFDTGFKKWDLVTEKEAFVHANSILIREQDMLVLAQNDYPSTGYQSAIKTVDFEGKVSHTETIDARCAHDLVEHQGKLITCSSHDSTVLYGGKIVIETPGLWARGIAVIDETWIAGGSEITKRAQRLNTSSHLFFFQKDFELIQKIEIDVLPSGERGGNVKCIIPA